MRRIAITLGLLVPLWMAVGSVSGETLIQKKGTEPDVGYPFFMVVPCMGTPSGLTQLSIDTLEEAAAVAAFVEGRMTIDVFVRAMVSSDEIWASRRDDLLMFADVCKPNRGV